MATIALAAAFISPITSAQESVRPWGPAPAEASPPAPATTPPGPADAIAAFNAVEAWIRAAAVPEPPAPIPTFRCAGASVALRQDGVVIGRGSDISSDGLAVWRAARRAWEEAAPHLHVTRDALMDRALLASADALTISLELAGAPVPLHGRGYDDLAAGINPGLTGVAIRAGERWQSLFPGAMLASGATPDRALAIALSALFEDDQARILTPEMQLRPLAELREREGVAFYKFDSTHVAQPAPGAMPVILHRGGRVVEWTSLGTPALRAFADGLASHLISRCATGGSPAASDASDGAEGANTGGQAARGTGPHATRLRGTLHPTQAGFDPPFAGASETAITALALRRYAAAPGADPRTADAAAGAAIDLLASLARPAHDQPEPWKSAGAAAACIVAYLEGARPPAMAEVQLAGLIERCRQRVLAAFDPGAGFSPDVPAGGRGLAAWALVRLARDSGAQADRELAAAALRAVYLNTPVETLVAELPWLGWAEQELAGAGPIPAAVVLREVRQLVWKHQLAEADLEPHDRDLAGGIVFTRGRSPLPNWNSARPLAFMASMGADPRLTEDAERDRELARVLQGVRFLRQLAADPATCWMYRAPGRAMWGVRAELWDQRMPPDATSLTLLAVCEVLALGEAPRPRPQPPSAPSTPQAR